MSNKTDNKDRFTYEAEHFNIHNMAPDNGKRLIGNAPWWLKFQLGVVLLSVIMILFGFAGALAPFEPYKIYGWKNIPREACPGDQLSVSTISEVSNGPYTIKDATGFMGIVNSSGRSVDTWNIDTTLEKHPKQITPSNVVRIAPETRGYYRLELDVDVHGRMFWLVPRYQEVHKISETSFFVRSEFDPRCKR
jgi:hypothetical protein